MKVYRTLLSRGDYYPPSEHIKHAETVSLALHAQKDIWQTVRDARVCVFDTTLLEKLALHWSKKSQIPSDQEIWAANRTEPYDRDEWERCWPGATPPRTAPPFTDTLIVFSFPITAKLKVFADGYDVDEPILLALLCAGDLCMGIMEHDGVLFMNVFFDHAKVYYTMASYIAYVTLDALMRPEIEMSEAHFSRKQKKQLRRSGARVTMGAPAPYYEVRMTSRFTPTDPKPEPEPIEWSHRWDVRAHRRVLVRRGALPMPDRDRSKLTMRGYRIFEGTVPLEVAHALAVRHKPPKRDDEWIAVKTTTVKAFQKGPEDKPYVPSVRTEAWSDRMEV